jgi:hypothetical protein
MSPVPRGHRHQALLEIQGRPPDRRRPVTISPRPRQPWTGCARIRTISKRLRHWKERHATSRQELAVGRRRTRRTRFPMISNQRNQERTPGGKRQSPGVRSLGNTTTSSRLDNPFGLPSSGLLGYLAMEPTGLLIKMRLRRASRRSLRPLRLRKTKRVECPRKMVVDHVEEDGHWPFAKLPCFPVGENSPQRAAVDWAVRVEFQCISAAPGDSRHRLRRFFTAAPPPAGPLTRRSGRGAGRRAPPLDTL